MGMSMVCVLFQVGLICQGCVLVSVVVFVLSVCWLVKFVDLSVCSFVCPFACLLICLSICLSVCLSVCSFVHLFVPSFVFWLDNPRGLLFSCHLLLFLLLFVVLLLLLFIVRVVIVIVVCLSCFHLPP